MDKKLAQQEIDRLLLEIEEHNYRYYVCDDPVVSDQEYDEMLSRLAALETFPPNSCSSSCMP